MQLVVLGMHRSGTSALVRALGLMGAWLGDEGDFLPTRDDNPGGDWERRDVWQLDEEALAAGDAAWDRVAAFDPSRLPPDVRLALGGRARAIVERLDAHRPWAIKDPRLCLTLPVWRPALDAAVCVIVWRRPIQVAESLRARDGIPLPVGVALWERYVLAALAHSRGLPRVLVSHAALLESPRAAVRDLGSRLEALGVRGLRVPDDAELASWIDPRLYRARGGDAEEAAVVDAAQRRLASALAEGTALDLDPLPELSAEASRLLERFGLERRLDALARDHERLGRERDDLARRNDQLTRERDRLARRGAELERERDEAAAARDRAVQRAADADRALAAELRRAVARGDELTALIELVLGSRRWRFGERAGALYRRIRLQPAVPEASTHAERIVGAYRAWRERALSRTEPADGG